jgi:hypothetical protein
LLLSGKTPSEKFANTPMRRTRSVCCARAASGRATAAPPSNVMNARRFIQ